MRGKSRPWVSLGFGKPGFSASERGPGSLGRFSLPAHWPRSAPPSRALGADARPNCAVAPPTSDAGQWAHEIRAHTPAACRPGLAQPRDDTARPPPRDSRAPGSGWCWARAAEAGEAPAATPRRAQCEGAGCRGARVWRRRRQPPEGSGASRAGLVAHPSSDLVPAAPGGGGAGAAMATGTQQKENTLLHLFAGG